MLFFSWKPSHSMTFAKQVLYLRHCIKNLIICCRNLLIAYGTDEITFRILMEPLHSAQIFIGHLILTYAALRYQKNVSTEKYFRIIKIYSSVI